MTCKTLNLATLISLALTAAPRPADACHPPMCADQIVRPGPGMTMPANAPAILLYPRVSWGMPPAQLEVLLEKETAAGMEVLSTSVTPRQDGSYEVAPTGGFEPNTNYLLTVPDYCEGSGKLDTSALQHKFSTATSAPLPQQLGTVQLGKQETGQLTVATVSGMCESETLSAQANVSVALAAEAKPWSSLLVYEARVDSKPFSFSSSLAWDLGPFIGHATKVYAVCSCDDPGVLPGVSPGKHQVTFRATVPGADLVLETPALGVRLDCPVSNDDLPGPDGGLPPPASDGGPPPPGSDGGLGNDTVERSGCSVTGSGGSELALVLLPLLLLRRRRP
ncbi:MAG: hypothetical protein JRI55_04130 [Deltaproteobacteria bacterium]|nr:hypothetical protein [Deltaproteobacteria bacterium]